MNRASRFAVGGLLALAACVPSDDSARAPRYTLIMGIDVSGSFQNSGSYEDAVRFASHYLEAHLNGFGGLQVPTDVFVGSVGGTTQGEAKTFHPIHDFLGKDRNQIEADLRTWFPSEDQLTDFNTFFAQAADLIKQRGLTLAPLNMVLFTDGVPDVPRGSDPTDPYTTIDVSPLEYQNFLGVSLFAREGEPLGQLVGAATRRDPNGNIIVNAAGGHAEWTDSPVPIGNVNPDWRAGWSNSFSYGGARLSVLLDVRHGGHIYSGTNLFGRATGVLAETVEGRCTPPGGPANLPGYPICDANTGIVIDGVNEIVTGVDTTYVPNSTVINAEDRWILNGLTADQNLEDAGYVKLRELTLSYSLPTSLTDRWGLDGGIDVSAVGRNLLLWTNARHLDPETALEGSNVQGFEYGQMPSVRSFGFNITVRP